MNTLLEIKKADKYIVAWGIVGAISFFATWYFAFMPFLFEDYYIGLGVVIFCYAVLQSIMLRRLIAIDHKYLWIVVTSVGAFLGLYLGRIPMASQHMVMRDLDWIFWVGSARSYILGEVIAYGMLGTLLGLGTSIPQSLLLTKTKNWSGIWTSNITIGLGVFHAINIFLIYLYRLTQPGHFAEFAPQDMPGVCLIAIVVSTVYGAFMMLFLIRLIHSKSNIEPVLVENS